MVSSLVVSKSLICIYRYRHMYMYIQKMEHFLCPRTSAVLCLACGVVGG